MYISLETLSLACLGIGVGFAVYDWLSTPKYNEFDEYGGWFDN